MKHLLCILFALGLSAQWLIAGSFGEQLIALKKSGSGQEVQKFIEDSSAANQADPEYFILAANYWWGLAQEVNLSNKPSGSGEYAVTDPKTGKEVGSLSSVGAANPEFPQKAIDLLSEGLKRNPYRFDIAMGLAYILREQKRLAEYGEVLKQALKTAAEHPDQIRWQNGVRPGKPLKEFIPETLQGYTAQLYQSETQEGDQLCKELCGDLIKHYPDHPYAYNVLAALSSASKDYKACIAYLLVALKKSPGDTLVMFNLGDTYKRTGDKASAKRYYEMVLHSKAPANEKAEAKQAISGL